MKCINFVFIYYCATFFGINKHFFFCKHNLFGNCQEKYLELKAHAREKGFYQPVNMNTNFDASFFPPKVLRHFGHFLGRKVDYNCRFLSALLIVRILKLNILRWMLFYSINENITRNENVLSCDVSL